MKVEGGLSVGNAPVLSLFQKPLQYHNTGEQPRLVGCSGPCRTCIHALPQEPLRPAATPTDDGRTDGRIDRRVDRQRAPHQVWAPSNLKIA